jgi:hypothetical protein
MLLSSSCRVSCWPPLFLFSVKLTAWQRPRSTFLADFIPFRTLAHFFPISVEFVPVVE